ncbi:MAG: hypothetical protein LBJ07_04295, partial [Actinomycetes bacterium]|nr:hypothetical protein [Actinomycetes bacterium]
MKVIQISTADLGGGAERIARDLHRGRLERNEASTLAVGFRFEDLPHTVVLPNDERRGQWARLILRLAPAAPAFGQRLSPASLGARRALQTLAM